ncbi:MAG TPA: hypothetical protein VMW15_06925 [Terracidiphilus sp.]|jgi:hypothetical protein|nr:hypothetical protein [Terracidiphilus sp.]
MVPSNLCSKRLVLAKPSAIMLPEDSHPLLFNLEVEEQYRDHFQVAY